MYSSNLWSVAEKLGWWKPGPNGPKAKPYLNFVTTYAPQRYHPNYSNRRVWRIFSLAAPDMKLNPNPDPYALEYPFSVKVSNCVTSIICIASKQQYKIKYHGC